MKWLLFFLVSGLLAFGAAQYEPERPYRVFDLVMMEWVGDCASMKGALKLVAYECECMPVVCDQVDADHVVHVMEGDSVMRRVYLCSE